MSAGPRKPRRGQAAGFSKLQLLNRALDLADLAHDVREYLAVADNQPSTGICDLPQASVKQLRRTLARVYQWTR